MTATVTTSSAPSTISAECPSSTRSLWRGGAAAGIAAAAATMAVAATAHGLGVSFETEPGKAIPLLGFGQLTIFFTVVGILIARTIGRRAAQPRSTLVRVTVALTALSFVPDIMLSAGVGTKVSLMLTHAVAAAIVIPTLAARLPERGVR